MSEFPVNVGTMLFTMVDPHRGHEVAYNRWYERDHFYAGCMIGPGILSGARWVATRELKDLRFPESSPFAEPVDAGSYLAIYWISDEQADEWQAWAGSQVWWLYQNGRGFDERTHAQTGMYDFAAASNAPHHGVPVTLALDHRYASMHVVVSEPSGDASGATLARDVHEGPVAELLARGAIGLATSWTMKGADGPPPADDQQTSPMALGAPGGSRQRVVQLLFSDLEPTQAWDDVRGYTAAIESSGLGRVTFAAPFLPTDVGTDRHTDQLW